jgi:uncharacterized repeat protein (TIGR02543 family)
MAPQSILEGHSAALTANAFTRQGFYFAGWSTGVEGSPIIADGATYTMGKGDVTLTATWSTNPAYEVTFDPDGGTGTMAAQAIVSGLSAKLASNAYAKRGYAFVGWATSKGGAVAYSDCASLTMGNAPVTLWAVWAVKQSHTLRFDASGGTGTMSDISVVEELSATIPANSFTKSGCRFVGWATASGGPVAYASGTPFVMGTADVTLYAVWEDRWTVTVPAESSALGVAVDQYGNSFVVGYIFSSLDDVNKIGVRDAVVRKYDASGRKLWSVTIGASGKEVFGFDIAVDASGTSYICGASTGNVEGQTCAGSEDMLVAKITPAGSLAWTQLLGSSGKLTIAYGIDCDSQGNVFVTGITSGSLDGQSFSGGGGYEAFITRYDANGTRLWTKLLGGGSQGNDVAVDSGGNAYMTGYTNALSIDGKALIGSYDLFVCKYDQLGRRSWISRLGTPGAAAYSYGIILDGLGSIFACGYTTGNLNGNTLTGTGDMFVGKFDTNGNVAWVRLLGSAGALTQAKDICADRAGNVYVTGTAYGNLDGQVRSGSRDSFVVKYLPTGDRQWTRLKGSVGGNSDGEGICYDDATGAVIVSGSANSPFDGQTFAHSSSGFLTTRFTP